MSLRLRLTLLSILIMGLVSSLFGTVAFYSVRYYLYGSIDGNLDRQITATASYIRFWGQPGLPQLNVVDPLGVVHYTVFDARGRVLSSQPLIVDESLISLALEGKAVFDTRHLADGTPVRVSLTPIRYSADGPVTYVLQAVSSLQVTEQALQQLTIILAATSVLLLLAAAWGSFFLTGRALRAVDTITRKAHQIELSQDLTQRIPGPGTDDEVGHLVSTFNQMLARLQGAFEAQRRFVADSSHELRTPLTVIRSNLHLLKRTVDADERIELIEIAEGEVSRLNRMVNDLLYMAQMQAGHSPAPVMQPVEMDSLLLDTFGKAKVLAAAKDQRLVLAHESIATVTGDRDQLQHLLLNLLDNAVKYTQPGGIVSMGLWVDEGWARLEVSDNGPGIPPNDLPYIFERFFRANSARKGEHGGTGLGLAIVRSIAAAHAGHIEALSSPEHGTTFRFLLPTTSPADQDRVDTGAFSPGDMAPVGTLLEVNNPTN